MEFKFEPSVLIYEPKVHADDWLQDENEGVQDQDCWRQLKTGIWNGILGCTLGPVICAYKIVDSLRPSKITETCKSLGNLALDPVGALADCCVDIVTKVEKRPVQEIIEFIATMAFMSLGSAFIVAKAVRVCPKLWRWAGQTSVEIGGLTITAVPGQHFIVPNAIGAKAGYLCRLTYFIGKFFRISLDLLPKEQQLLQNQPLLLDQQPTEQEPVRQLPLQKQPLKAQPIRLLNDKKFVNLQKVVEQYMLIAPHTKLGQLPSPLLKINQIMKDLQIGEVSFRQKINQILVISTGMGNQHPITIAARKCL